MLVSFEHISISYHCFVLIIFSLNFPDELKLRLQAECSVASPQHSRLGGGGVVKAAGTVATATTAEFFSQAVQAPSPA